MADVGADKVWARLGMLYYEVEILEAENRALLVRVQELLAEAQPDEDVKEPDDGEV